MAGSKRTELALGAALIVGSALCFGSLALFARIAYADGVDAPTLLMLRFGAAACLIWGVVMARRAVLPRGRALYTLVAMGGLGYAGQAMCYFGALTAASAGLVALLLYLYPALVAILARVFLGHRLTPLHVGAIAIALVGTALTIGEAIEGSGLGIILAILGSLIYSVYILVGSRLPPAGSPAAATAVVTSSAALVYIGVGALRGVRLPTTAAGWGAIAAIAAVGTALAIVLFLAGLERIGAVRASIYSTAEPVFTVLLAALFLGEALTWRRIAGGGLILSAVVLLARADLASIRPAPPVELGG
jgi:drug/metabolite transporter (DMT)-like permease